MTQKAFEKARHERLARDVRETVETLLETRTLASARAWAEHCMVRSSDGFWRLVRDALQAIEREGE